MRRQTARGFSIFLCIILVLSALPMSIFANSLNSDEIEDTSSNSYTNNGYSITIDPSVENGTAEISVGGRYTTVKTIPDDGYYASACEYSKDNGETWTNLSGSGYDTGVLWKLNAGKDLSANYIVRPTFSEIKGTLTIANLDELIAFRDSVNSGNTYAGWLIKLESDIDLSSIDNWEPIGTYSSGSSHYFSGEFDGQGHTVSNMVITSLYRSGSYSSDPGFFDVVQNTTIKNLTVTGSINVEDSFAAGGIVASTYSSCIENCTSYVNIDANGTYVGGIVGNSTVISYGLEITNCINYGNITGVGSGIVGCNSAAGYTKISSCGNYGSLERGCGIIGSVNSNDVGISVIDSCFNKGNINSSSSTGGGTVGGIAGIISNVCTSFTISNCYNTGNLSAYGASSSSLNEPSVCGIYAGGLSASVSGVVIQNCYNMGTLSKSGLWTATETRYGEICMSKDISWTGHYGGSTPVEIDESIIRTENCYTSTDTFTAKDLGDAFKDDVNGANGGYPLLTWESSEADTNSYSISFEVTPSDAEVTVYSDSNYSNPIEAESENNYSLTNGTYYYEVACPGYITVRDSFNIISNDQDITVELSPGETVMFTVNPTSADFTVSVLGKTVAVDSISTENDVATYFYTLDPSETYTYSAYADGYCGITREMSPSVSGYSFDVTLTPSDYGTSNEIPYIYGSDNGADLDHPYIIDKAGTYYIAPNATGTIYITEALSYDSTGVTLIGQGTGLSNRYNNIYIECQGEATRLTLKNAYIYNSNGIANMINFRGDGNQLIFSGVSILDQDTGATGYAMIHVNESTSLEVTCDSDNDGIADGVGYIYKREQGAGIGGNGGADSDKSDGSEGAQYENNGTIKITNATLYMKNSKQGALIGSGAKASALGTEPGNITIENSTVQLIAISRGAAIGGSAGSTGGASGATVRIIHSNVTINVDWSGAAIGGGGFDANSDLNGGIANDANGGTLIVSQSSIRTFIDENATTAWAVSEPGVHENIAITAAIQTDDGEPLYLYELDTSEIEEDTFTIYDSGNLVYQGGLHQYAYLNETLPKNDQISINYTMDNWIPLDDSNLYLYLTGEDHVLTVNDEKTYYLSWDEESKTFTTDSDDEEESAYTVSLNTEADSLKPGDTFTVEVQLAGNAFESAKINLTYDSDSLDVTKCELKAGKVYVDPTFEDGTGTITFADAGVEASKTPTTVAVITFQVKENAAHSKTEISVSGAQVANKLDLDYTIASIGDSVTVTISSGSDHVWDDGVVTTEATCTIDGVKTYTCTVCGETYTEAIPAPGHTVEVDAAVEPTCTATGLTEGSHCSVCGEILVAQETVPALGHDYVASVIPATYENDGQITYTCSRCGDSNTVKIPQLQDEIVARSETGITATVVAEGELDAYYVVELDEINDSVTEKEVALTEKAAASLAENGETLGYYYLNIDVFEYYTSETYVPLSETNWLIRITVDIPEAFLGADDYTVIRIHEEDGEPAATILETTYDAENGTVTFETDEFSTYAIVSLTQGTVQESLTIDGDATYGSTLTAGYSGTDASYQWYRDGIAIEGATNSTYILSVDDIGASISVTVNGISASIDGTVSPKQLSVTGTTVADKTYDGTTNAAVTPGTLVGVLDGDQVTLNATAVFDSATVGTRTVTVTYTLTGADAAKYLAPEEETFQATISAISSHTHSYQISLNTENLGDPDTWDQLILTCSICGDTITRTYCPTEGYTDNPNEWYHGYVDYVVFYGIMNGTSTDVLQFSPDVKMTRSQMVQLLYNLAGNPSIEGLTNAFSDVTENDWYYAAVVWACNYGVANGNGEGQFLPDGELTREQVAQFLYNYAKAMGCDTTTTTDLAFFDAGDVDDWALEAVQWAVGAGLINGYGSTDVLEPLSICSRAEAATMMVRFCEEVLG